MALRQVLMAMVARAGFVGLVTACAETQCPPGALIDADNVVIRRAGQVEPRNGITRDITTPGIPVTGFSYGPLDFYVARDSEYVTYASPSTVIQYNDPILGLLNPQPFRRDCWTQTLSRANLYYPYDSGVLKLLRLANGSTALEMAGLPPYASIPGATVNAGPTWLGTNEHVAYRVVSYRKDANGLEVRSIPSGATIVQNTGAPAGATLYFDALFTSRFDAIEVYRTRNFPLTVTVDDEMQLVATLPSTTTTWVDTIAVAGRGATLYTSPSRGGIIEQNNRPPAAAVVATFKNSVFFGNTRGPAQLKFSYTYGGDLTGVADGIGTREYTGNIVSGDTAITSLSSVVGLEPGQLIGNANFPDTTYVVSIVGTTANVSEPATGSAVADNVGFLDTIRVGANRYLANAYLGLLFDQAPGVSADGIVTYQITPPEGGNSTTVVVETLSRLDASMATAATHGSSYSPPIADYASGGTAWTQDVFPGGLYWSKPDEPEHVRPINFAYVGDKSKAILGLVPTRDALFILKEDGVWRLTGVNQNWQIDPYDPTTFCMLPTSVKALNGRGYMLGNKGVVRVGDDGVQLVSGPINDQVKPVIDQAQANFLTTGYYEVDGVIGSTAAIFAREAEYLLLRSSSAGAWVYNEYTDAWTTWSTVTTGNVSPTLTCLFDWPRTGKCAHGLGLFLYTTLLTTDTVLGSITYQPRFDREEAVTASTYAPSGALTLTAPVNVLADDAIQDANGVLWVITEDGVGATTVQAICTNLAATSFGVGACVLYRSLRCRVASFGFCEPGGTAKAWQRYTSAFTALKGPHVLRSAYESSEHPHSTPLTYDTQDMRFPVANGMVNAPSGFSYQDTVPGTLGHIRAWMLHASTRWAMAFGTAKLEAVFVDARPMVPGSLPQVGA